MISLSKAGMISLSKAGMISLSKAGMISLSKAGMINLSKAGMIILSKAEMISLFKAGMISLSWYNQSVQGWDDQSVSNRDCPAQREQDRRGPGLYLKLRRMHCNENPIFEFLEKELLGLSPNLHIHVFLSDLQYIFLKCIRIDRPIMGIYIADRSMNVEIGTEAAQFLFIEYLF
jgi:hypothetical protein